jgi:hypothetical protein
MGAGRPSAGLRDTRQAVRFNHAPIAIGHGELEDGLCNTDGIGSSMHVGSLAFVEDLIPAPMNTRTPMWRKQTRESVPSINTDRLQPALAATVRAELSGWEPFNTEGASP